MKLLVVFVMCTIVVISHVAIYYIASWLVCIANQGINFYFGAMLNFVL